MKRTSRIFRILRLRALKKELGFSSIKSFLSTALFIVIKIIKIIMPAVKRFDKVYLKLSQRFCRIPGSVLDQEVLRVCITYQCNVNCSFCYAQCLREEFKRHMSLDDFEFLVKWAKSQGWKSFRLLGGEPTFHPYFKDILDIARREKLTIAISTNGLFDREVNTLLNRDLIESINFSYPQTQGTSEKKELFYKNLIDAIHKDIPVIASWIIYFDDGDNWRQIVDLAKKDRDHIALRFSMALPGNQNGLPSEKLQGNLKRLASQILELSSYAYQNQVKFFFYRPLLRCMFSEDEFKFLQSIAPFLFYTRCPINLGGDYVNLRLTINPDLTCYPCPVLHIKGIKIIPDVTREDIGRSFKRSITQLCAQHLMESCKGCLYFANYKHQLENKSSDLIDKEVCQGGCLGYKKSKS